MKRVVLSLAALALSTSIGWAADQPAKPGCAFVRSIDNWKPIDDKTALIYTSPRRKFKVTFFSSCRELKWAIFARLETRPSAGVCLSVGDTLIFGRGALFPNGNFQDEERCTISAIEALPFDEKEPLPPKPAEEPPH